MKNHNRRTCIQTKFRILKNFNSNLDWQALELQELLLGDLLKDSDQNILIQMLRNQVIKFYSHYGMVTWCVHTL